MRYRNRSPEAVARARQLRREMGESEKRLWQQLRNCQLGFRFRRQVAVGPYYLDFYCPQARLCIEVDGDPHVERRERDTQRDAYLLQRGIYTLRVWTSEVYENLDGVLERIYQLCVQRTTGQDVD